MRRRMWLALAIVALLAASFAASSIAARRASDNRSRHVTRGLDYLHSRQQDTGGFTTPANTAWAILGAVANGERMGSSAWAVKGKNPFEYLQGSDLAAAATTVENAPEYYAQVIMAYVAVGKKTQTGTAGSKGINLFTLLWAYQDLVATSPSQGAFSPVAGTLTSAIPTTAWAVLGMQAMGALNSNDHFLLAEEWLSQQQANDGGFSLDPGDTSGVLDTALAIQALKVGREDLLANWDQGLARQFLANSQLSNGGFPDHPGDKSVNADATSAAIQAIVALGEHPQNWKSATGLTPIQALRSLQEKNGAYRSSSRLHERGLPVTSWALVAQGPLAFTTYPKSIPRAQKAFRFRPQFKVVSPKNGTKFKHTHIVLIRATYTDFYPHGTGINPRACRLYVDNANKSRPAKIGNYGLRLQLKNVANGDHTYTIKLVDHAGNQKIIERKFTVDVNTPPTPQPTANPTYTPIPPVYPTYTPRPSHTTTPKPYTPTPTPYQSVTPYPYNSTSPYPSTSGQPVIGSPVPSPSTSASPGATGGGGGSAAGFVGGTLLAMLPIGAAISFLALQRREEVLGGASQGTVLSGGGSSWERFKNTLAKSKDLTKPSSRK